MQTKKFLTTFAVILVVLTASLTANAQTPQQAAETYNWAIKNYKKDIDAAIDSLEKFEQLADSLIASGELEGQIKEQMDQLQAKAHKYLPTLYYKSAITLYKQMRTDMAITRFQRTIEVAKEFGNENIQQKSEKLLPQLYYKSASEAQQMMDYQKAISMYNKAIEYDPDWAKAYLKKALAYKSEENDAQMIATIGQTIEVAKRVDDQESLKTARRIGQTYYWQKGANLISDGKNEEALAAFNKALEFDKDDFYAYYYVALAKNKLFKYTEAIADGEKALELLGEEGDREDKAMIYLQLGIAHGSLGKTEKGCEYFKKAEFGKSAAKAKKQQDSFGCSY
jgi:tetratricopeptide (TPR) repeat protein